MGAAPRRVAGLVGQLPEAADAWLADADQPSPLRRLVHEGRDGIARALRCRERDAG